jgi:hypothetical protein
VPSASPVHALKTPLPLLVRPRKKASPSPVGFAEGVTLPSPADFIAVRISIEPGAISSLGADDPTSGLLTVESGTITVRVDAFWTVDRGAALQQVMATPPPSSDEFDVSETIAASEEATLSAGDVAYIPAM